MYIGTFTQVTVTTFLLCTVYTSGLVYGSAVYELQTEGPPDDYTSISLQPACLKALSPPPTPPSSVTLDPKSDQPYQGSIPGMNAKMLDDSKPTHLTPSSDLDPTFYNRIHQSPETSINTDLHSKVNESNDTTSEKEVDDGRNQECQSENGDCEAGDCKAKECEATDDKDDCSRIGGCHSENTECKSDVEMTEYSICVAFSISSFTQKATVYSYAINQTYTNMLALAVTPRLAFVSYNYRATEIEIDNLYMLGRWRRACTVGQRGANHTFYLDGTPLASWPWKDAPPLLAGGALVLGQDQDLLLGGYSASQAFRGKVTELNVWQRALTFHEIQQINLCKASFLGDWVSWNDQSWTPHGRYNSLEDDPCQSTDSSLVLFNMKLPHSKMLRSLSIMGLQPYLPQSRGDVDTLHQKLTLYGSKCQSEAIEGLSTWINAVFNFTSQQWEDAENRKPLSFYLQRHPRTYESSEAAVQIDNNKWMTDDVNSENCFAGLLPQKGPLFHLRGLKQFDSHPDHFPISFVITQTPEKNLHFKGLQQLVIEHRNYQWEINDYNRNKTLAKYVSHSLPIGRLPWSEWQGFRHQSIVNLTFSICSNEEFTCDDGSCVSMDHRCDLEYNCRDWSDERNCDVVITPPGYLRSLPPSPALVITLTAELDIIKVVLRDMTLMLDIKLRMHWYDPGVSYRNLRHIARNNIVTSDEGDCPLWKPKIEVEPTYSYSNQRSTSVMVLREGHGKITRDNIVFRGKENRLRKDIKLQPEVRCTFDLLLFPWDKQQCSFNITVTNINQKGMEFNMSSIAHYVGRVVMEEYVVEDVTLTSQGNTASVEIVLRRRYHQYLWHTFLPTTFLLAIGYGTLFLPISPFNDRGTMSLTTLLVLVALYTDALTRLPDISYNTHADVWYIFSMVYLTLIIATHLYTSSPPAPDFFSSGWVSPSNGSALNKPKYTAKFLRRSRFVFAIIFIIFVVVYAWQLV